MRWIGAWLAGVGCVGAVPPGGLPPTEAEVNASIDAANYCTDPSECVDLGSACPFGCWILVNAAEAESVEAELDAYFDAATSTCTYSCSSMGPIECRAGRCEADPVR
jgi:hypothetical protein